MTIATGFVTAEWICTRCGVTNRKLLPPGVTATKDACVSCHARHEVEVETRPVRWRAKPLGK